MLSESVETEMKSRDFWGIKTEKSEATHPDAVMIDNQILVSVSQGLSCFPNGKNRLGSVKLKTSQI